MSKQLLAKISTLNELKAVIREVEAEARVRPSMEHGERLSNLYSCLLNQIDCVAEEMNTSAQHTGLKLVA